MFNPTEALINSCVQHLQIGYRSIFGSIKPNYPDIIGQTAKMALEKIAKSDALYHNVEHTVLVTLVGQEILQGKQIREGSVSCEDWLHFIISLLCHDIGYVKGICQQDTRENRWYATGVNNRIILLPFGTTDASLTPYHVDRGKQFIEEYFGTHWLVDAATINRNIELTRFPVPNDTEHKDTIHYPGLARSADLIGQLSDQRYLQKIPALFYEFEEIGMNKTLGYRTPGDLRQNYPNFFRNVVYDYIQPALRYLQMTLRGKQIITNLQANVLQVDHEKKCCDHLL